MGEVSTVDIMKEVFCQWIQDNTIHIRKLKTLFFDDDFDENLDEEYDAKKVIVKYDRFKIRTFFEKQIDKHCGILAELIQNNMFDEDITEIQDYLDDAFVEKDVIIRHTTEYE